jgi:excisionase family DNA binding protein
MSNETTLTPFGISIKEAIKVTGLGRTTLWKAINSGRLGCYKVGRRILFDPDLHLRPFLQSHERCVDPRSRSRAAQR